MSEAIVLKVDGMGCQSCVSAVQKAVALVTPSASVSVDLTAGEVRIENAEATVSAIKGAIEGAGYDVTG
jgi:copper chaperone